jgi:type I restriction enzyme M protein
MPQIIRDYVTGKSVSLTAEETVRQQFEHILVDELDYPKTNITIEFPIQRGARRRAEKADIAVFKNDIHEQTNLYMVIEIEAPGNAFDDQVFSYVTATTAEFAVWFDGLDRKRSKGVQYRWRDLATDPTRFIEIPAIPRFGESLEEIGRYRKSQLYPARSPKGLFQKMHNRLYGEGPLKREDAIAQEVIKLLFCKLYDELHTPGETCEFRATVTELKSEAGRHQIANRIRNLYQTMKNDPHYGDMFAGEELQYDDYWISYIVSELQGFGLTHEETDTDAMGDAYEIFVGPQLKGESGQFFTPRAVVRLAVDMLKPSLVKREQVIDPACGSGGFLIYTLRAAKREAHEHYVEHSEAWINERVREYANNFITGIDAEPLLFKVAKSYMAIVGNGRTGIFCEDALQRPNLWKPETRRRVELDKFDVLITNPPFGTRIKVEVLDTLRQYDVAYNLRDGARTSDLIRFGQDPAILFLERSWQLLHEPRDGGHGGKMAIVLPRQILSGHDSSMMELRNWVLRHMKILAVVDLPPETFQPYTGTITSLLFAERVSSPINNDYDIFMAVADYVGHDRRGNPMLARNLDGSPLYDENNNPIVLDDMPKIATSYEKYLNQESFSSKEPSIFSIKLSDILNQPRHRIDAWFHDPNKNEVVKKIWDLDGAMNGQIEVKTIGQLIREPSDVFYPGRHKRNYCRPGPDAVPFLSGTNVLQVRPFDVKWQPLAYKPIQRHLIEKGWILVTRSGSTGRVLYVGDNIAGFSVSDGVAVTEHVIRIIPDPDEVDPGYLFSFLSSESVGKVLLAQGIYASVVRHITPEHIRAIPVPLPPREIQEAIGNKVREAEKMRSQANMR